MRLKRNFILSLLLMLQLPLSVFSKNGDEEFARANKFYIDQSYEKAIEAYEKMLKDGYRSVEVYFNLGNAYYKNGSIASAILNYERAKRLRPSDPDILYNLRMANLHTIDKIDPVPQVFYERWWDNFVNNGSVSIRSWMLIGLFWLALIFAVVYLFSRMVILRKLSFYTSVLVLIVAGFTWYLTYLQQKHLNDHRAAVIFVESVYAKSSPDESSANLFMLHAGTRIEILDTLQGWKKIRIANGNEGWLAADAVESI